MIFVILQIVLRRQIFMNMWVESGRLDSSVAIKQSPRRLRFSSFPAWAVQHVLDAQILSLIKKHLAIRSPYCKHEGVLHLKCMGAQSSRVSRASFVACLRKPWLLACLALPPSPLLALVEVLQPCLGHKETLPTYPLEKSLVWLTIFRFLHLCVTIGIENSHDIKGILPICHLENSPNCLAVYCWIYVLLHVSTCSYLCCRLAPSRQTEKCKISKGHCRSTPWKNQSGSVTVAICICVLWFAFMLY